MNEHNMLGNLPDVDELPRVRRPMGELLALAPAPEIKDKDEPNPVIVWFKKLPPKNRLIVVGGAILLAMYGYGEINQPPTPIVMEENIATTEETTEEVVPDVNVDAPAYQVLQESIFDAEIGLTDAVAIEQEKITLSMANDFLFKLKTQQQKAPQSSLGSLIQGSISNRVASLQKANGAQYLNLLQEVKALQLADALIVTADNRTRSQQYAIETYAPSAISLSGIDLNLNPQDVALKVNYLGQQQQFLTQSSPNGMAMEVLQSDQQN